MKLCLDGIGRHSISVTTESESPAGAMHACMEFTEEVRGRRLPYTWTKKRKMEITKKLLLVALIAVTAANDARRVAWIHAAGDSVESDPALYVQGAKSTLIFGAFDDFVYGIDAADRRNVCAFL